MILSSHILKHVRRNLKFFHNNEKNRQINLGKPLKCSKNNSKKPTNKTEEEKSKSDAEVSNKETKPYPEEPTTCCMSGCANCVWLEYAEKISEYFRDGGERAIKEINEKVTDENIKAFLLHELRMRKKKK